MMKFYLLFIIGLNSFASVNPSLTKERLLKRKSGLTSRTTHKRLERAARYTKNKEIDKAINQFVKLLKITKKRKYEQAIVWQNLGFTLAGAQKTQKAIKALNNSLKLDSLPYSQTLASLYTLAQLYFSVGELDSAQAHLEKWFSFAQKPTPQAYMLMGMILGQNDKKLKALDYVNMAINNEKKPSENWLQFALSLNHSLKKYQNSLKILVTLTSLHPEKEKYWKQFYQTYLSLHQDKKALVIMDMAYKKNFIKSESEILNMVSLMLYLKMPHKGARILRDEMLKGRIEENKKNYELLSQAWYQSKEKELALLALDKAASYSSDGELFAKKGHIFLEDDKWDMAIDSYKKSLKKGKLKDRSKIYYALGLSYYNNDDLSKALDSLLKVNKNNEISASVSSLIDEIKNKKMAKNEKSISL